MKFLFFLLIFFLISNVHGYEVNITDSSVNEVEVKQPTVNIDIFGNATWKYPIGFFEAPKQLSVPSKPNIKNKNSQVEPKYARFIKGNNTKKTVYVSIYMIGSLQGINAGFGYSSNFLTHNLEFSSLKNKTNGMDEEASIHILKYKLDYHAFPQWYINSPQKRPIDCGLSFLLGYSSSTKGSIKENSPAYGVGAFINYHLIGNISIKANVEILSQPSNKALNNKNSTAGLGLALDF